MNAGPAAAPARAGTPRRLSRPWGTAVSVLCAAATLGGCERAMQDMYRQPKYRHAQEAPGLPGDSAVRALPGRSVVRAQGVLAATSSGRIGEQRATAWDEAERAKTNPLTLDMALLRRGRERFDIYCAPCHGLAGDGDGIVPARGFPHPPSYHEQRLRAAPDRHFYDVMSDGYGIMYSYADRVTPPDRWAIVAYIRALQLSRHAPAAQLTPQLRERLDGAAPKGAR